MTVALRCALALILVSPLFAICNAPLPAGTPRSELRVIAGYSPDSATALGTAEDRKFVLAGASYSYTCMQKGPVAISYTVAAFPAAITLQPRQITTVTDDNGSIVRRVEPAHSVYGFAVAPLGFTFNFRPGRRLQPFLETLGGVIASVEPIPERQLNAAGLNFTFDFGAGLRVRTSDRRAVVFGYKFLHISNASTTGFNPGLDNNVICIGYSFMR